MHTHKYAHANIQALGVTLHTYIRAHIDTYIHDAHVRTYAYRACTHLFAHTCMHRHCVNVTYRHTHTYDTPRFTNVRTLHTLIAYIKSCLHIRAHSNIRTVHTLHTYTHTHASIHCITFHTYIHVHTHITCYTGAAHIKHIRAYTYTKRLHTHLHTYTHTCHTYIYTTIHVRALYFTRTYVHIRRIHTYITYVHYIRTYTHKRMQTRV